MIGVLATAAMSVGFLVSHGVLVSSAKETLKALSCITRRSRHIGDQSPSCVDTVYAPSSPFAWGGIRRNQKVPGKGLRQWAAQAGHLTLHEHSLNPGLRVTPCVCLRAGSQSMLCAGSAHGPGHILGRDGDTSLMSKREGPQLACSSPELTCHCFLQKSQALPPSHLSYLIFSAAQTPPGPLWAAS